MVTPPPADRPGETPAEAFAETIETVFNGLKPPRTLTDDDTEVIYLTTLAIVTRALQGSQAQGIITEEQLGDLDQMLEGLRQAPRLV
jgi:hypothetical protein